ncbi:hypothetical protein A8L45_20385 [Veronia pacifica]|uniref:Nudix hydrolase domain-containing protein n=1 Tax=Veronia pacifica TaxID=1080227 RepID=A0A1C3EAQ0_9GAMM|nr:hypothetical protein A8L45_20385 [Veronia pacifica]
MTAQTVTWGEHQVRLSWLDKHYEVDTRLITSCHGYCWHMDNILVIENSRGCELPGGHREVQETPEECLIREVIEEACLYIKNIELLGYIQVDHSVNTTWTKQSGYPKVGYIAFFNSEVSRVLPFEPRFETHTRHFISVNELTTSHHEWLNVYDYSLLASQQVMA